MKRAKSFFLFAFASLSLAQQGSQITVTQNQDPNLACDLQILFDPGNPQQSRWFADAPSRGPGADSSNYKVYVVLDADTPNVRACDKSKEYLDSSRADSGGASCSLPGNDTATCP